MIKYNISDSTDYSTFKNFILISVFEGKSEKLKEFVDK